MRCQENFLQKCPHKSKLHTEITALCEFFLFPFQSCHYILYLTVILAYLYFFLNFNLTSFNYHKHCMQFKVIYMNRYNNAKWQFISELKYALVPMLLWGRPTVLVFACPNNRNIHNKNIPVISLKMKPKQIQNNNGHLMMEWYHQF